MRSKSISLLFPLVLACPTLLFGAGTVSGKVTYTGTPAKAKPIDMSKESRAAPSSIRLQ